MNDLKTYNLLVIGGGPAGVMAAMAASTFGHSVALVDKQQDIGGAGINTGTVPSKTLRETALALSGLRSRNLYGVDLSLRREVTVADFLGHEERVKEAFHASITDRLKTLNAEIFRGTGSFVDAHTIRVELNLRDGEIDTSRLEGEIHLRGEKILIATGSSPVRPDIFPFGLGEIYDSDTILKLASIPKILAVAGAGVIGVEYACTFSALGAEVHIVDGREVLLPFLDAEVSRALTGACQRNGIVFHWNERVQKCIPLESDGVRLELSSGAILTANAVLVAAGRQSNTAHLGLEKAGVKTGARGLVHVNEHFHIVGRANYRENARGRIIGDQEGFLKLLFRQADLKLIGVHVMGELATEVVHIGLIAMMCDASANLFGEACLNMPTLGMLYKAAALDVFQKLGKSQKDA